MVSFVLCKDSYIFSGCLCDDRLGDATGPPCDHCGSAYKYFVPKQPTKTNAQLNAEIKASKKRKLEKTKKEIKMVLRNEWLKTMTQTEENREMDLINRQYFQKMADEREKRIVRELEWTYKNRIEKMTTDIGYDGDDERLSKSGMSQSIRSMRRRQSQARKKHLKICKKLRNIRL